MLFIDGGDRTTTGVSNIEESDFKIENIPHCHALSNSVFQKEKKKCSDELFGTSVPTDVKLLQCRNVLRGQHTICLK